MIFRSSSIVFAILCALLLFATLTDAAGGGGGGRIGPGGGGSGGRGGSGGGSGGKGGSSGGGSSGGGKVGGGSGGSGGKKGGTSGGSGGSKDVESSGGSGGSKDVESSGGSGSGSAGGKGDSDGGKGDSKGSGTRGGSRKPPKNQEAPGIIVLPREEGDITEDDASVFSLRSYEESEQRLFESFDEQNKPYFSVVFDFFLAKESYIEDSEKVYAKATGTENPFDGGRRPTPSENLPITKMATYPKATKVVSTFSPLNAAHVCRAWSTMVSYCGDGSEDCACYSGTFYVPDQWNSLAAGCAPITSRCDDSTNDPWCLWGRKAAENTAYCEDNTSRLDPSTTIVRFAAVANIAAEATEEPRHDPSTVAPTETQGVADETSSTSFRLPDDWDWSTFQSGMPWATSPSRSDQTGAAATLSPTFSIVYNKIFLTFWSLLLFSDLMLPSG